MASVLSTVNFGSVTSLSPESTCCVVIAIAKANSSGNTSVLYAMKIDSRGDIRGNPFQLSREDGLHIRYIWDNSDITKELIRFGSVVTYREFGNSFIYSGQTEARKDLDEIQMQLEYEDSAYRGIKEACPKVEIGETKGMYLKSKPEKPIIFLVSLKYGFIKNERITFVTKNEERVDLKLNCRENLILSTGHEVLQLRTVTDEDDVGDVAVVKFGTSECSLRNPTFPAVCEGLILKHKPLVLSTDSEPVKIKNKEGKYILVPGTVKIDTGNECRTGISQGLVDKLELEVDHRKKMSFVAPGGAVVPCSMVPIKLKIRRRVFKTDALVGAHAHGVDLLISKDIIDDLHDENYTIGV